MSASAGGLAQASLAQSSNFPFAGSPLATINMTCLCKFVPIAGQSQAEDWCAHGEYGGYDDNAEDRLIQEAEEFMRRVAIKMPSVAIKKCVANRLLISLPVLAMSALECAGEVQEAEKFCGKLAQAITAALTCNASCICF